MKKNQQAQPNKALLKWEHANMQKVMAKKVNSAKSSIPKAQGRPGSGTRAGGTKANSRPTSTYMPSEEDYPIPSTGHAPVSCKEGLMEGETARHLDELIARHMRHVMAFNPVTNPDQETTKWFYRGSSQIPRAPRSSSRERPPPLASKEKHTPHLHPQPHPHLDAPLTSARNNQNVPGISTTTTTTAAAAAVGSTTTQVSNAVNTKENTTPTTTSTINDNTTTTTTTTTKKENSGDGGCPESGAEALQQQQEQHQQHQQGGIRSINLEARRRGRSAHHRPPPDLNKKREDGWKTAGGRSAGGGAGQTGGGRGGRGTGGKREEEKEGERTRVRSARKPPVPRQNTKKMQTRRLRESVQKLNTLLDKKLQSLESSLAEEKKSVVTGDLSSGAKGPLKSGAPQKVVTKIPTLPPTKGPEIRGCDDATKQLMFSALIPSVTIIEDDNDEETCDAAGPAALGAEPSGDSKDDLCSADADAAHSSTPEEIEQVEGEVEMKVVQGGGGGGRTVGASHSGSQGGTRPVTAKSRYEDTSEEEEEDGQYDDDFEDEEEGNQGEGETEKKLGEEKEDEDIVGEVKEEEKMVGEEREESRNEDDLPKMEVCCEERLEDLSGTSVSLVAPGAGGGGGGGGGANTEEPTLSMSFNQDLEGTGVQVLFYDKEGPLADKKHDLFDDDDYADEDFEDYDDDFEDADENEEGNEQEGELLRTITEDTCQKLKSLQTHLSNVGLRVNASTNSSDLHYSAEFRLSMEDLLVTHSFLVQSVLGSQMRAPPLPETNFRLSYEGEGIKGGAYEDVDGECNAEEIEVQSSDDEEHDADDPIPSKSTSDLALQQSESARKGRTRKSVQ